MTERSERGGIRQRIVNDYEGHRLYDERGEKIGKVEYTVLDADGRPEYLAVKTGWFGSNTTLIPESVIRPGERDEEFTVQASEDRIKDAPTFDNEDDVTPDFEDRVREYFGLSRSSSEARDATSASTSGESRDRGSGYPDEERGTRDDDRAFSESRDREGHDRDDYDLGERESRESRGDETRDDRRDSGTGAAVAGGAAGGAASGMDRESDREGRRDDQSGSGERETVRVMVKRERARAERIRGADGQEEVRIRKEMVEEEEMVEVEDRL